MKIQKGLPLQAQKTTEEKFREVSDLYEKHFMREMVKAMRSTVQESGFIKSNQAEKIFRDQLDDEYVNKWSDRGGIGMSDLIYDQLMEKFGSLLKRNGMQKPAGPLPMTEKANTSLHFQLTSQAQTAKNMDMKISPKNGVWPSLDVKSPWSGTLLKSVELGNEEQLVEIDHGNGLLGKYVFKGWSSDLASQTKIEAGQVLGKISPDSGALYWSLKDQSPETPKRPVE
jgi:peptidoglycan hydrolase FlgJ